MDEITNWPTAFAYIVGSICFTIIVVTLIRRFFG